MLSGMGYTGVAAMGSNIYPFGIDKIDITHPH
ncbi:Uncharacterised protein [Yersinia frederiksenii]|nr:Uncharacterised protein [Yersinia frederiksenii]